MLAHNINKLTVTKHHYLTTASYYLPVDERRLILSALSLVNPESKMPDEIKVTAKFFADQWGLSQNNAYTQLKRAKENLYERSLRVRLLNSKSKTETWDIRWVDAVAYEDGEGYIKLSFSRKITPYLSDLKKYYNSHRLADVNRFKSGHAIRLYELIMQWKKNEWYSVSVSDFRDLFGVSKKHDLWSALKRYVVDVAVDEINKSGLFHIEYETKKKFRKTHTLLFRFYPKSQNEIYAMKQMDLFKKD